MCLSSKVSSQPFEIAIFLMASSNWPTNIIKHISLLYMHGEKDINSHIVPVLNTRAANVRKYRTEIYKNSKYKNSPYYKAAKLWDSLP